ncbi:MULTISPECIES: hypothetical protein [unclassified Clostridium]|uniref:hypothetical protein n=1 Tax=unclassified Clostridium TaxID=2614128 RepID=UPI002A75E97E|nr:hypothetical protein [Clostridium sp.]MDY2629930.1 hypothetical protein [Clostridium sp.]MDY4252730.1 hypothetical protein [Clostridium sp.]
MKKDVNEKIRTEDVIDRSLSRLKCYNLLSTEKVDVSKITPKEAAEYIIKISVR